MNYLEQTVLQKQNQIIDLLNQIGYGTACNPRTSGEGHAIYYALKNIKNPIVFDIGAYHGEFTEIAHRLFPDAKYHCFEPDPIAFNDLNKWYGYKSNIHCNNFAISDLNGKRILYTNNNDSGLCSLNKRELDLQGIKFNKEIPIESMRLETYCKDYSVNIIDYLKLDIEGAELSVLSDAYNMIENGRINNIQFEFGGCNIDSRTFMKDFYILLSSAYNIYRIHPEGLIDCNEYKEVYEVFQPVNYYCELKL